MSSQTPLFQWRSRFPPELTDNIIDEVATLENASGHSTYQCLRPLSLVSRSWIPRTRHHAFSQVTLRLRDRDDFKSRVTALQDAPGIGKYIQRLRVDGRMGRMSVHVDDLYKLMQTTPNLRALALHSIYLDYTWDRSSPYDLSFNLDKLSISHITVRNDFSRNREEEYVWYCGFKELMSLFSIIKYLELDDVYQYLIYMPPEWYPSYLQPGNVTSRISDPHEDDTPCISGTLELPTSRTIEVLAIRGARNPFKGLQQAFPRYRIYKMVLQPSAYNDLGYAVQFGGYWPLCTALGTGGHCSTCNSGQLSTDLPKTVELLYDIDGLPHPYIFPCPISGFLKAIGPSTRHITIKLNLSLLGMKNVAPVPQSAKAVAALSRACIDIISRWPWNSPFSSLRRFNQLEKLDLVLFSAAIGRKKGKLQHVVDLPHIEKVNTEFARLQEGKKFSASWWSEETPM